MAQTCQTIMSQNKHRRVTLNEEIQAGLGLEPSLSVCSFSKPRFMVMPGVGSHGDVREAGLVHQWSFCLHAVPLLAPGGLARKGAAGPTTGTGPTRGTGIDDAGPNGLVTRVGCGTGVAGQPRTQNH